MGRRSSIFEDLFEIAEALPWWIGILLAIISYALFHAFAVGDVNAGGSAQFAFVMIKIVSSFLQYLVPMSLVLGAILSAVNQAKQKKLFDQQTGIDSIRKLNWREFETLVGEAYRRQGFQVTETSNGADGGIDLILRKTDKKIFVQCKHWKRSKVGVKEVRELNGIVAAECANSGILVITGAFTAEALRAADKCPIELIDGSKLVNLLPHTQQDFTPRGFNADPICPRCGHTMIKRVARRGANVGKEFFGCSEFPKCKGIINI